MRALQGLGVEAHLGDLRDPASLREAVKGIQVIFHCAALVTDWALRNEFIATNVKGTYNLLEAASEVGGVRFIHVSTNNVFGISGRGLITEAHPYIYTGLPYPDTKIESERLVVEYHQKGKIRASIIYPVWMYGPGDRIFLPEIVRALRSRQMVFIAGGLHPMYLSYVENVAQAMIRMSQKEEAAGEGFFSFDGGDPMTWRELVWIIADTLGMRRPRLSIPPTLCYGAALALEVVHTLLGIRRRPIATRYFVRLLSNNLRYEGSKLRSLLNFEPPVSPEEGMARALRWLQGLRKC